LEGGVNWCTWQVSWEFVSYFRSHWWGDCFTLAHSCHDSWLSSMTLLTSHSKINLLVGTQISFASCSVLSIQFGHQNLQQSWLHITKFQERFSTADRHWDHLVVQNLA
jgi:hypothetical protein